MGSLPFLDSAQAVNFVLDRTYIIPFWPELPQRGTEELMLSRAERALHPSWSGYLSGEASALFTFVDKISRKRPALIKGQMCGPLTLAVYSEAMSGSFSEKLVGARDACLKQLVYQRQILSHGDSRLLLLLDEPALVNFRELSLQEWASYLEVLSYLYVAAQEHNCFLGLHSCSAFDRSFLKFTIDLLAFDATHHKQEDLLSANLSAEWQDALNGGLLVVPGVFAAVPSGGDLKEEYAAGKELHARYSAFFQKLGAESRLLYSAGCGHANASEEWLHTVYPLDCIEH